jgi:hypothetical protein
MREVRSSDFIRLGNKHKVILCYWYNADNEKLIQVKPIGYLNEIEEQSLSQAHFAIFQHKDVFNVHLYAFKAFQTDENGNKIKIPKERNKVPVMRSKTSIATNKETNQSIVITKQVPVMIDKFTYIPCVSGRLKQTKNVEDALLWINRFRSWPDSVQDDFLERHSVKFERETALKIIRANYYRLERESYVEKRTVGEKIVHEMKTDVVLSSLDIDEIATMKRALNDLKGLYIRKTVNRDFVTSETTLRELREKNIKLDIIPTAVVNPKMGESKYISKVKRNRTDKIHKLPIGQHWNVSHTHKASKPLSERAFMHTYLEHRQGNKLAELRDKIYRSVIPVWDRDLALRFIDQKLNKSNFETEPQTDTGFQGYWYTDKDGNRCHTWDYEESIGE